MIRKRLKNLSTTLFLAFFLFPFFQANGQNNFYGTIVEANSKEPIPYTTLYLNNTTYGTVANLEGAFNLEIPDGNYEVIVRLLGYETLTFFINTSELAAQGYRIELAESEQELEVIEVEDERDDVWYRNLKTFKNNFLGFSINAMKSEILNEKALILDSESSVGDLKVSSNEVITILNQNLGYKIDYILSQFVYSRNQGKVVYGGNALFKTDTTLRKGKLKKVIRNRDRAYYGSIQHLMQSLYFGEAKAQGYIFRELRRIPNPERPSQELIDAAKIAYGETEDVKKKDSLRRNYIRKERLPEFARELIDIELDPESFIRRTEDGKVFLAIKDLLHVSYMKENEEMRYVGSMGARPTHQTSIIEQLNSDFEIFSNGNYSDTFGLLYEGYMAWEKVGDLMPLDYLPENVPWNDKTQVNESSDIKNR